MQILRALASLLGGGFCYFALRDGTMPWLGWIALAPLGWALWSREEAAKQAVKRGAILGLLAGLACNLPLYAWLFSGFKNVGEPFWLAALAWLVLSLYLSLYWAGFGAWFAWCSRGFSAPAAVWLGAAGWVALEMIRARAFTGFPWLLLGDSQWRWLVGIQVADLGGVYMVSFLVCLIGLAVGVIRRDRLPMWSAALAFLACLGYGKFQLRKWDRISEGGERFPQVEEKGWRRAALLQPNIDPYVKWRGEAAPAIFASLESLLQKISRTHPPSSAPDPPPHPVLPRPAGRSADPPEGKGVPTSVGVDVVVWPEASLPGPPDRPAEAAFLKKWVRRIPADHLIGVIQGGGRNWRNSVFLLNEAAKGGRVGEYSKKRLVPFGEFVPMRWLFGDIRTLNGLSDAEPGPAWKPTGEYGVTICYEAIFPHIVRRVGRDSRVLVNVTNDGWYPGTRLPIQHLGMNVLRSVENRRWLLRAANTGISAVVDPAGRIREMAPAAAKTLLTGEFQLQEEVTPYQRWGDWFGWTCLGLCSGIFCILSLSRGRGQRGKISPCV